MPSLRGRPRRGAPAGGCLRPGRPGGTGLNAPAPRREPHILLILLALAALLALLLPWLPAGSFTAGEPVSMASYQASEAPVTARLFAGPGQGTGFVNLLYEGFVSGGRSSAAIGVIAFVLMVGGAFGVVQASGAIDRGLVRVVGATAARPGLLLAALFVAFSLGGAVFGMGEETIAFLALLLPLLDRLGYRREVGVMVTYLASQVGFASSWMNPFSVAVAQGVAELPLLSGAPLRMAAWATLTTVALLLVLRHAARTRMAPVDSGPVPQAVLASAAPAGTERLHWSDRAILLAVAAAVAWIVWGVTARDYYIPELASVFVALAMVVGALAVAGGRLSANAAAEAFVDGARALLPTALVIALAKGLVILLGGTDPHQVSVLNAWLHGLAGALADAPPVLAAQGMLAAQSGFNLLVTSGSAQAAITMPLMAPLADLVGLTRQVAVLAFQFGDGLTNALTPVSPTLMGVLGVAGLSWTRWLALAWRIVATTLLLAAGFIAWAVLTGYA
ncbi:MAG: AbgT family transporter [Xanthomonadales bacterium]|nr:AbgT family transporter [Xanthomonadales bacterium]